MAPGLMGHAAGMFVRIFEAAESALESLDLASAGSGAPFPPEEDHGGP